MRKYGSDQLEDKRAYYAQQRIKPTGKFTEMIVRSYYIIWASIGGNVFMRKYGSDQLEDKRAYYAQQRIKPTGKFTEMIVRSYYIIWALAHTNPEKECFTSQVSEHKIKDLVYQDLGDPVASVVADARNELVKMYYVRYVKDYEDNRWKIRF